VANEEVMLRLAGLLRRGNRPGAAHEAFAELLA